VPYLREKKYPRARFPDLYAYRPLAPRLLAKIARTYKRPVRIEPSLYRGCSKSDFRNLNLKKGAVDAIVTSPPYMDTLDYSRDNRLRLWFLGAKDYKSIGSNLGSIAKFSDLMVSFFVRARKWLRLRGYCVLVVGELNSRRVGKSIDMAHMITHIATSQVGGFKLESIVNDEIPDIRRSRRETRRTKTEAIVVLRRK
jgi:hypothetical protein